MITFTQYLIEMSDQTTDLTGYVNLLDEVAMFITLNTSMIQQYATDDNAKQQLKEMQVNLRNPVLNGMSFVELHSKPNVYKMKNVIPFVLRYIYNLIKYVEPRLQRFIQPNHLSKFQNRLNQIKKLYTEQVRELSSSQ